MSASDPFVAFHFKFNLQENIRFNMLATADMDLDQLIRIASSIETGKIAIGTMGGRSAKTADSMVFDAPQGQGRNQQSMSKKQANGKKKGSFNKGQSVQQQSDKVF